MTKRKVTKVTLYDLVQGMTDKRLPKFEGNGVKREGKQVSFGMGQGKFFLCQVLSVKKQNGKIIISNTPY